MSHDGLQTVPCIDHPPYRWIRQHLLFHRWIWSKSTRPGILRGSWLVDCNDQGAWMWSWYHGSCSHTFGWRFVYIDYILRILMSLCCQVFYICYVPWFLFDGMFFTPQRKRWIVHSSLKFKNHVFDTPHTHTTLQKRNCLIWPVPPFCLLLGFSCWQGF